MKPDALLPQPWLPQRFNQQLFMQAWCREDM